MVNTNSNDVGKGYDTQNQLLWDLSLTQRRSQGTFLEDIHNILSISAHHLNVKRASLWLYKSKRVELECLTLYDSESKTFSSCSTLQRENYPLYFKACDSERFIDASDALHDPRTQELADNYLSKNSISSLLDAPVYMGAKPRGILCFEHVGPQRIWSKKELAFSSSIADLIALEIAERDAKDSTDYIQSSLETTPLAIIICDNDGKIIRINKKTSDVFGYKESEVLNLSIDELIPGSLNSNQGTIARVLAENFKPKNLIEHPGAINKSGLHFPIEYLVARLNHWKHHHALIVLSDISNRKEREDLLSRSELLYRSVVEDQTDLILRLAPGGAIRFANQIACNYYEIDQEAVKLKNVYDFIPEEEHYIVQQGVKELNRENPVTSYKHRIILPDGSTATISWKLRAFFKEDDSIAGYQTIGRDITDEEKRQQRAHQNQRLESLAVIAGGMAHDLNNLLTPILSYTDLAQIKLSPGSTEHEYLQHVMKSAARARELTKMVLIFSKREESRERHPIFASKFIREILAFIRSTSPSSISISGIIDSDCGVINANPSDLYQILSNLCTNAVHAMPAGGDLTVSSSIINKNDQRLLQVEVTDSGIGISKDKISSIFDPFFTTKPTGQGTGLGLSVVHSIIEELEGEIDCKSCVGKGSSFVFQIPLQDTAPNMETEGTSQSILTGSEHILVIDDESYVATTIRDVLENLGYQVTTRTSANEAITTFSQSPEKFDAVITDYTMPYMTGIELCWRLRRLQRHIPIVLMSGYGQLIKEEELEYAGLIDIINKPFIVEEIAAVLRNALNKHQST